MSKGAVKIRVIIEVLSVYMHTVVLGTLFIEGFIDTDYALVQRKIA